MVELIVVVVMLGVLAGLVGPRLLGWTHRDTEAAALKLADLLSAAARRDLLSSQRVSIDYDAKRGSARMQVLTVNGRDSSWENDPLVPEVGFGDVKITIATADGVSMNAAGWRVEFSGSVARPAVGVVLAGDRGKETYRVDLASRGARAVVTNSAVPPDGIEPLDLDAAGKEEAPW